MEILRPDATGIYVASNQATAAIEEAIEAEVPLIVAVAERKQPSRLRTPPATNFVPAANVPIPMPTWNLYNTLS